MKKPRQGPVGFVLKAARYYRSNPKEIPIAIAAVVSFWLGILLITGILVEGLAFLWDR